MLTPDDTLHPAILRFAQSRARPCTHIAAACLLVRAGKVPTDPEDAGTWRALDPGLWDAVNIYDDKRLWSGVAMVAHRQDVPEHYYPRDAEGPWLKVGCWYFVQRWSQSRGIGHAYLVQPLEGGQYRVVQSSTVQGFRDTVEASWLPRGYDAGVVELT